MDVWLQVLISETRFLTKKVLKTKYYFSDLTKTIFSLWISFSTKGIELGNIT